MKHVTFDSQDWIILRLLRIALRGDVTYTQKTKPDVIQSLKYLTDKYSSRSINEAVAMLDVEEAKL